MSRAAPNPQHRVPGRSSDWWIADEEPEIVSAEPTIRRLLSRLPRHRLMMLAALAVGALCSAFLL